MSFVVSKRVALAVIWIALIGCKSAGEKDHEAQLRARPESIERARAAADRQDWSTALDELNAAGTASPLTADEAKLHTLWKFRQVLDLFCTGKIDDLTASDRYQVPSSVPPGLDNGTLAKAEQLLARRELILQLRDLRQKQQALAEEAKREPTTSEECNTAINAVQSARTVRLNILRRIESDYRPGIYEVQDAAGQTARLTTTDTVFTTTGWTTITAYAFNDDLIIELSADHRAKAQECFADQHKSAAARTAFATSSTQLDAKLAAVSTEFIASCASPSTAASEPTAPPPSTPEPAAPPPQNVALSVDSVKALVKAQAESLTSTGAAFVESFDANAIAFFPQSLTLYEGRDQIAEASRDAWGHGVSEDVEVSDVLVGVGASAKVAWVTTKWKITLAGSRGVLPLRVTEVVTNDPTHGLRIIAASFSVAPGTGAKGLGEPAPAIATGAPPAREPDSWLTSPTELANHVRNDVASTLIGSDANEFKLGAVETQKTLASWKSVKLEFVGNVRSIDGVGYRIVLGHARWRGSKPTLFRVLGLFVPGEAVAGPAPWELGTAHYSVAVAPRGESAPNVPKTGSQSANLTTAQSTKGASTPQAADRTGPVATASSPNVEAATPKPAVPVEVYVVAYSPGPNKTGIVFQAVEAGKVVVKEGPGALTVTPGQPRTIVIRGPGWKDKTVVLDGNASRVEITMELSQAQD